ncbi:acyltransferase [Povalibacter sp.]|uniref:acyltransferase family protein n=1 Tax=Povalibacter sp. TaxID=1962978 RepID=UPI002F3EDACB
MDKVVRPLVEDLTRQHFRQLDGLRGIAILMVIACHFDLLYQPVDGGKGLVSKFAQAGWMGVDLFFVLSGFLITGILLATRDSPHYFRNFLARRFLRIWPLYYANLVLFFLVLPHVLPDLPRDFQSMLDKQAWFWLYGANWLFAQEGGFRQTGGGYFWSLAVEEQFYLLWPLAVYWLSSRSLLRLSIGLLCASLGLRLFLEANGVSVQSLYTITFTHLDGLAVGAILAIGLRSQKGTQQLLRILPYCCGISMVVLGIARWQDGAFYYWSRYTVLYGYTAIAVLAGCLLLWSLRLSQQAGLNRLLACAPLAAVGRVSYALYLIHAPLAAFLKSGLMPALAKYLPAWSYGARYCVVIVVVLSVSWLLAIASWHFFEKPILALKGRFSYDQSVPAPAAVGLKMAEDRRESG